MKNIIFIEQLFKIKRINNVLIVGNCSSDYEKCVIENTTKNRGNIYYARDENENNNFSFDLNSSSILASCNADGIAFDLIIVSEYIEDFGCIISKISNKNCVVVFENISLYSIDNKFKIIYSDNEFCAYNVNCNYDVFYDSDDTEGDTASLEFIYDDMNKRINSIYDKIINKKVHKKTKIGVGIITFNHEAYIIDCLDGVFKQKGDFDLNIVIVDDCSTDRTSIIIDDYLEKNKIKNVKFIKKASNKGVIDTLSILLNEFKNTDYFTFCEGDDFWISSKRLSKLANYMKVNPYVSVAFNAFEFFNHDKKSIEKNNVYLDLKKEFYLTQELIERYYFIGNLGCCFYDSFYLKEFDKKLFKMPLYDFLFNTYYSTFGLIGFYDEILSYYRIHNNSFWSTVNPYKKNSMTYDFINKYNEYFDFIYEFQYNSFHNMLFDSDKFKVFKKYDLLIIDNVFPNVLSPFSYEELSSYLYNINDSITLCTYLFGKGLSNERLFDGLIKYKLNNRSIANKVFAFSEAKAMKIDAKLMYFIFKSTTMYYYNLLKKKKCDFVFELYPGGGFLFDDPECDNDLRKIMKLKGFKKVIVTQEPVKKYLIEKKLCKENQIEMIFGVVMNEKSISKEYNKSKFFGMDKDILDIVFMAHRYNEIGSDKGYDLFIAAAKKICKKYNNVNFHIVGNYDSTIIDVSDIKDHITFYGTIKKDEFDSFFIDKDIILSPNRPGVLAKGAFDGFPTASCTEAGVRKVVMMCSDELNMSEGYYIDMNDFIVIKNNVDDITSKIEYLYNNPDRIKFIAENGRNKILDLYSYDNQIKPRLNLLNDIINKKRRIRLWKRKK